MPINLENIIDSCIPNENVFAKKLFNNQVLIYYLPNLDIDTTLIDLGSFTLRNSIIRATCYRNDCDCDKFAVNLCDPESLKQLRKLIKKLLSCSIDSYNKRMMASGKPENMI